MIDINRAMLDPSDVFTSPDEVVKNKDLTLAQKIKILRQWEYDEREMMIAEEENMGGENGPNRIDRIHQLLLKLEAEKGDGKPS